MPWHTGQTPPPVAAGRAGVSVAGAMDRLWSGVMAAQRLRLDQGVLTDVPLRRALGDGYGEAVAQSHRDALAAGFAVVSRFLSEVAGGPVEEREGGLLGAVPDEEHGARELAHFLRVAGLLGGGAGAGDGVREGLFERLRAWGDSHGASPSVGRPGVGPVASSVQSSSAGVPTAGVPTDAVAVAPSAGGRVGGADVADESGPLLSSATAGSEVAFWCCSGLDRPLAAVKCPCGFEAHLHEPAPGVDWFGQAVADASTAFHESVDDHDATCGAW